MEMEFKAKTLDEAKALAAEEFGVAVEDITFEIISQPKKSLFGMKGEAIVKAIYEAPVEEEPAPIAEEEPAEDFSADEAEESGDSALPDDFDVNTSVKVQSAIKYLSDVLRALGL